MSKTIRLAAIGFAVLFILMTALLALDLSPFSWIGLLMHLLPSLISLIILLISLSQEKIGGILWILASIVYVVLVWGDVQWLAYLMMSGPALIIGILFLWPKSDNIYMPKVIPQALPISQSDSQQVKTSETQVQEEVNNS